LGVLLILVTVITLASLGVIVPWSPVMDAWSGLPTPVVYVRGRSPLELQGAVVLQNKQCRNCHRLGGAGGRRGPALDGVATRLTKPRVVLMGLVTTAVGYRLGSVGTADWVRLLQTLVGTSLAAAGTLALNQYLERGSDGLMRRTQRRALPSGRLTASEALAFGILATFVGLGYLAVVVGV